MAGITSSTVGFNAVFTGITKTVSSHSLFSVDSKLCSLRLSKTELSFTNLTPSPRRAFAVTCRFGGGGGGYRFSGDNRRGRPKEAEIDEALDISSIR